MAFRGVDEIASGGSVDEYQHLRSYLGVPVPLPLFSPVPVRRTRSAPISQPVSPPLSPAPTVLVSLHNIDNVQASGSLSLHEYRKNLSRPQLDGPFTPGPKRTLRRKPKALNLNVVRSPKAPPSPPPTPISVSPISPSGSVESLWPCQSLAEPVPSHDEENFLERIPSYTSMKTVSLPNITPSFTAAFNTSSQQIHAPLPSIPPHPPCTPETSIASGSARIKKLNALRDCLKQIPVKFISHHKSSSDSALFLSPYHSKTRLRHRGVSFEILNPTKSSNLQLSSSSEHIRPDNLHTLKGGMSTPFFDPMSSQFLDQNPSANKSPQAQETPLKCASRSRPESEERRPTPPRALFEDLPTAYSSITSRIANQRSNLFPLFPYIDHSTGDLDMELSFDIDAEEAHVTLPPNCPDPLASHSEIEVLEQPLEVLSSQEFEVPSMPFQDVADNPRTTFAQLVLSGASIGQLSTYFSSKTSRSDSRSNGEVIRRHPSKLTKPRPLHRKQSSQWKKLRSSGASNIISRFIARQLSPNTACSRVEKRNTSEDVRKNSRIKTSTAKTTNYRRSVSSPLKRISADVEAIVEQNLVSVAAYPKPYPVETRLKVPQARPRSSVYSSNDEPPPELYNQIPADVVQTDDSCLINPHLSTDFSCKNKRHRNQWSSTSSPNFSKPIHPLESHPTGVNTPEFPMSYSSGYPNRHPNSDPRHTDNMPENFFNAFPAPSPMHVTSSIPTMGGDPGTLQSSSISGIVDHDFTADEYDDMGPGSSQTASSPQLSHLGTFSTLKSRFKLPSTLSSRSKGSGLKTKTFKMQSLSKECEQFADQIEAYRTLKSSTALEGSRGIEREDAHDWQTVAESKQFRSDMRSDFSEVDTGSSLANYSSYGSLENAEAQPWTPLALSEGHQHFPGSPSNPVMVHPGQKGLSHKYRLHQNSNTGNGILLPDYQYLGKSFESLNSMAKPMPVLKASTEVCPTHLVTSTSQYQHPMPLNKPHVHPFQNPPPILDKGKTRLRKQSLYQPSRIGPGPTTPSSKSNFFDFSCHQQPHQQHQSPPLQYQHSYQYNPISRDAQYQQNSASESLDPSTTVPSDWCTMSSSKEMSMSVFNRDPSSHPRRQGKHNPFSFAKHSTTNNTSSVLPQPFKKFNNRYKRPFSHKYPRMSMFATEALATNEHNSHHSLSLTANTRSEPRDYSPGSSISRGDVLRMPERAHLAPTYSSTDQLIPSHNRPSGDGITATTSRGTGPSHESQSLVCEIRYQESQCLSVPRLRWPLMQDNDNQTTHRRMKSLSRDDLIRERIRQLDNPIVASNTRQSRRDPPRPLSEGGTIPHRPHTVASRPVNINEELEVGQWYCSENGRYAFSTPPRLFKTSAKYRQRTAAAASPSRTNFTLQRRVGREVIIGTTIMLPLGWLLLGYIALVGEGANWVIKWRSGGEVGQFHYKDIRFARQVFGAVFLMLVIIGFITVTAVQSSRDN